MDNASPFESQLPQAPMYGYSETQDMLVGTSLQLAYPPPLPPPLPPTPAPQFHGFLAQQLAPDPMAISLVEKMPMRIPETLPDIISGLAASGVVSCPPAISQLLTMDSENPAFSSARDSLITGWLQTTYPELFLSIPSAFLSPEDRRAQERMLYDRFVRGVFCVAARLVEWEARSQRP